jgi:hypothetical protein
MLTLYNDQIMHVYTFRRQELHHQVDSPHQELAVHVEMCLRVQGKSLIFTHPWFCINFRDMCIILLHN